MRNKYDITLLKIPLQRINFYVSQPATVGQLEDCFNHIIGYCYRFMHDDSLIAILIDPDEMPDDYKGMYNQILMNTLSRMKLSVWEEIIIPIIPNYFGGPLWSALMEVQPTHVRSFFKLYLCYKNQHAIKTVLLSEKHIKVDNKNKMTISECFGTIWTLPIASDTIRIDIIWDRILELYCKQYSKPTVSIPFAIDTPLSYIDRLKKHAEVIVDDTSEHKKIAAILKSRVYFAERVEEYTIAWFPIIIPKLESVLPKVNGIILKDNNRILQLIEIKVDKYM